MKEEDLTLEKCIKICKTAELTNSQLKLIQGESKIHILKTKNNRSVSQQDNNNLSQLEQKNNQHKNFPRNNTQRPQGNSKYSCSRCGRTHKPRECPAFKKTCTKCRGKNHFSNMCKSKNIQMLESQNTIENQSDHTLFINNINCSNSKNEWLETIIINKRNKIQIKLDSGAQCNVISLDNYEKVKTKQSILTKTNIKLNAFGGNNVKVIGKSNLMCKFNNRPISVEEFIVADGEQAFIPTIVG